MPVPSDDNDGSFEHDDMAILHNIESIGISRANECYVIVLVEEMCAIIGNITTLLVDLICDNDENKR